MSVQRLSALDTGFLLLESPRTPMHMMGIMVVEGRGLLDSSGRLSMGAIRRRVGRRVDALPKLRQRLKHEAWSARPAWVDDQDFSITNHVRSAHLDAPSSEQKLLELCADLNARLLDRARPLWELTFVSGLSSGRVAVVEKIHHCFTDGIGGIELATMLADHTADRFSEATKPAAKEARESRSRRADKPILESLRFAATSTASALQHPNQSIEQVRDLAVGGWSMARSSGLAVRADSAGPLDVAVGARRRIEHVAIDLEQAKQVAHRHQATVNDVLLSVVSGALQRALAGSESILGVDHVNALVPVNIRPTNGSAAQGADGNRISLTIARLPIESGEPLVRLQKVRDAARQRRSHRHAAAAAPLFAAAGFMPVQVLRAITALIEAQPLVNAVVSNMRGPEREISLFGSRVLEVTPVIPLAGHLPLAVGAISYNGTLHVGVHLDPEVFATTFSFGDAIADEMRSLVEADRPQRTTSRRESSPDPSPLRPRRSRRTA
jgi:diacylglycerol O-acyltransferase / wax synthase